MASSIWYCPCGRVCVNIDAEALVHVLPVFVCELCGRPAGPVNASIEVLQEQDLRDDDGC